jgi:hypothetical protein
MAVNDAHELYRTDRDSYLAAFWKLEDGYEWSEDELGLVDGLTLWIDAEVEGLAQGVAMGYLAGRLEAWRPELAEYRISTILRDFIEEEIAEKFGEGWDAAAWSRIMYCVFDFQGDLERFVFDSGRLNERLRSISDVVAKRVFSEPLGEETLSLWQNVHRYGMALCLYVTWLSVMDELGVPEHERWTENVEARPISDTLVSLDLPIEINGCEFGREDLIGGYEIESKGRLGGRYSMRFRAIGDMAEIVAIVTEGRVWTRTLDVPLPRHVDVLRKLGFSQMAFPNGKRYELRTWPGVRRIKE